jgi:rhodanese-related sulfurtransferase
MFGRTRIPAIDARDVQHDARILDVREPDEWAAGHIDGAQHIPMNEIPARVGEISADADLVVVCRVGGRSAQVVAWLNSQGYDTVNLEGGLAAWARAGRALVSETSRPPVVL